MSIRTTLTALGEILFGTTPNIEVHDGVRGVSNPRPLEGFYFCPENSEGLKELSTAERVDYATQYHGAYVFGFEPHDSIDLQCALDNMRIPTHCDLDTSAIMTVEPVSK